MVSRYALCATIDDVIVNTPWGSQGQWDHYNLLTAFNQDTGQQERFFFNFRASSQRSCALHRPDGILCICLSLGLKAIIGQQSLVKISSKQICNHLYKQIRAHQGAFSKTLSPFPIKAAPGIKPPPQKVSISLTILVTASIILVMFIGLGYLLDTLSHQVTEELVRIGKSIYMKAISKHIIAAAILSLLSAAIWFAGPLLSLGHSFILQQPAQRFYVISLLFLTWLLKVILFDINEKKSGAAKISISAESLKKNCWLAKTVPRCITFFEKNHD